MRSSILNLLDTIPLGNVIVGIILLGLAAFIFWKFYTAIVDPYIMETITKALVNE
jgi:uncharacterized membrane protein